MSDRFYSDSPIVSDVVTLAGPEAHHLAHVMRAAVGDPLTLFDGSGAEFDAVVEKVSRANVAVRVVERREVDRELPFSLVIGVALPKGDRQKWLVEKLTELGVTTLVPLATERGVAQSTSGALERLQRSVIEASKQCGRNRLMQIARPQAWTDWIVEGSRARENSAGSERLLLAHPQGASLDAVHLIGSESVRLAIGPEGGFSEAEVAAAREHRWQPVALGRRILRVETAAVALAAAIALRASQ